VVEVLIVGTTLMLKAVKNHYNKEKNTATRLDSMPPQNSRQYWHFPSAFEKTGGKRMGFQT